MGTRGWGLWFCHLKCLIFQVVAVHLVRNLYYFRGKASKIQHSSVFHTPGQSLMHLSMIMYSPNQGPAHCSYNRKVPDVSIPFHHHLQDLYEIAGSFKFNQMSCQVQNFKLFARWLIQEQCKPAGNT